MAKGFQPGNKMGKGRPSIDRDLKAILKVNKQIVDEKLSKYMFMKRSTLAEIVANEQTPSMDLMIISIIKKGITGGDPAILNFLLDRTIGKVKENVEVDLTMQALQKAHDDVLDRIPAERIIELVRLESGNAGE